MPTTASTAGRSLLTDATTDPIGRALAALRAGRPVIVVDDVDRENEGDLIFAAEHATPELMAFMVRHTSGFVCVAMPGEDCDRLRLPPMARTNHDSFGTAYCVTVDLNGDGVTTGISARDRARTARALSDPDSRPEDFRRPGHVVPLRARSGGVLTRPGHTEAAVDLTTMAGLHPAGVLCEITSTANPGQMARRDELRIFASEHHLEIVSIAQLVDHRRRSEPQIVRQAVANLPTVGGRFNAVGYYSATDHAEHLVLVRGPVEGRYDVPVHVHTECMLGDIFGSCACNCRQLLDRAITSIDRTGCGIVVYLRPPTSQPARLAAALEITNLSNSGIRTVPHKQANGNRALSAALAASAADILADLGTASVRLFETPDHGIDPTAALNANGLLLAVQDAV